MSEQYKHLQIERDELSNERRTQQRNIPSPNRENILSHSEKLGRHLTQAVEQARKQQVSSKEGDFVLKLTYSGSLDPNHLSKHGIEFVGQEGKQLCVVFSDEQGLTQFADHLAKLGLNDADLTYKQILEAIEGIDNWTEEDRKSWAIKKRGLPNTKIFRLDVELWPVEQSNHPKRTRLYQKFEAWLETHSVVRIDKINLDSLLMYRVEVNQEQAQLLLNHRDVRYVDVPPQSGISHQQLNVDISDIPLNLPSPTPDSARICVLDSGVNTNHPLLKTAIGENESYVKGHDTYDDCGHGTAVAGVALYGDVEACAASQFWEPPFWLYSGKIMFFDSETGTLRYDEKTIEKTLIDAVDYFAGERGCRIFNLSIGNSNSPYDGLHVRGVAYILDSLARKYNVLFVVSAGNFLGTEELPKQSWRDEYPEYLMEPDSVIIDPAPALNILTVGSLARHNQHINEQRYPEIYALSPAGENQPSPFTRHGPSVKGAIKPELVAVGGNLASPMRFEGRQWEKAGRGMGVLTFRHDFVGNTLLAETSGTSFAAPYITHLAGRFLNDYPQASANMLRAMLVNHANLPNECTDTFSPEWRKQYKEATATKNRELPREVAGYGKIDEDILYRSTEQAVVLMAEESIENDAHQFFELPLPSSFLRTQRATRELRVTLAYSPPVRTTRLEYTATKITYRLVKGASLDEVQQHFNYKTREETETRNDDATKNRTISSLIRDKGSVQSSFWTFKQRNPDEKWFVVVTRQDRDWGANVCLEKEPYALVVTVTDRDNQEARLYTEIQARIREQQRARIS